MAERSSASAERHEFQLGSFVLGLLVIAVATLFLVNEQGIADVDQAVAGAVLLLVAAAASIIRALVRLLSSRIPG